MTYKKNQINQVIISCKLHSVYQILEYNNSTVYFKYLQGTYSAELNHFWTNG